jgi:eukaryotic-like serine/threonine-protein kinase
MSDSEKKAEKKAEEKPEAEGQRVQTALPVRFGKYLLVERIAQGGMAEIFKAKSYGVSGFEKTIVIKRILPSFAEDHEFIEMLIDEAKLCASLQHANIVQIHDLGRLEGRYFIAMEFVDGVDLVQVLYRLRKAKSRLPVELTCFVMSEALKGLDFAHRATAPDGKPLGIVHRDFNPGNLLLSFQGEVKVADFGIAKARDRGTKTMSGGLKGKMGYLSPEQVEGRDLDGRSDVFCAGITLWELLTNKRMFGAGTELDILIAIRDALIPDVREHAEEVPDGLVGILSRALARRPEDRFRSAAEFKDAIDDFLFDAGIKISSTHMEGYLKHLFADRISAARQREEALAIEHTRTEPPRYWVRQPGSKPSGPVVMEQLNEMISSGLLTPDSEVLREGQDWKRIQDVPELSCQLTKLPTPEESDPNAAADYQGLISEVSFPKLFYRLAIAKGDGRLVLSKGAIKKEIYLRQGMPEFVKSNIPAERLGEYLVERKIITEAQRDEAVKMMSAYSGRLGDTLVAMSLMQLHELAEVLAEQVREKILEVFSWSTGAYRFYAGQTYKGEVIPLRIGSYALIAEGVRRYTSMEMLKNRYRSHLARHPGKLANPYLGTDRLGLQAREQRVADLLDGKRSIRDLLSLGGSDRETFEPAVYRVLYILEELEMVEIKD